MFVFAEDAVDADGVQVPARVSLTLVLAQRPKQRAVRIIAMPGADEVVVDPLGRLRVDRQR